MTTKKTAAKSKADVEEEEVLKAFGLNVDVTLVKRKKLSKQDQAALESNVFTADDEFSTLHELDRMQILPPPFNLRFLVRLCTHNNALMQNIGAMEVNVDGTGHEILPRPETLPEGMQRQEPGEPAEPGAQPPARVPAPPRAPAPPKPREPTPEELEIKRRQKVAEDFFDEPWPAISFVTIRREMRRALESTGVGYFEIIRNAMGKIMLLNNVDPTTVRLVRLDTAVVKEVTLMRDGQEENIKILARERRYVQRTGMSQPENVAGTPQTAKQGKGMVFFKEYRASRDLNKFTGVWATEGATLAASDRATELLMFTVNKMPGTSYGIPRWINQIPSILGSRRAEELNLDFFNSGGLPPAMIIVQGGVLTGPVKQQIQNYLSGKGASKHRAMVLEVHAAGGDMDKPGTVKVNVERFGSERMKDSMFETYDEKSEKRVRSSFRLPPLFVGRTEDFNFASANVAYLVAEAQVFKPERDEFDEIMDKTLMREIAPGFMFRSLPITLRDVQTQLKALELAVKARAVKIKDIVSTVNEIAALTVEVPDTGDEVASLGGGGMQQQFSDESTPVRLIKMGMDEVIRLAREWAVLTVGEEEGSESSRKDLVRIVENLPDQYRDIFHHLAAVNMMAGYGHDPEGVDQLTRAAAMIINEHDCRSSHGTTDTTGS